MLETLNAVNDVPVISVFDPAFASYGRVLEGYDFSQADAYMRGKTDIPENGNMYVPSVSGLEALGINRMLKTRFMARCPCR